MGDRVTIVDVAKAAGVSLGTASNALNGTGRIADDTRARVAEVAAAMGYRPRTSARALRRGNTMAIGLRFGGGLLPQADFIIDLLNGAAATAHARGYGLLISAPDLNEAEIVDGLIVVDPISQSDVEVGDLRVITVGRAPGQRTVASVDLDYQASVGLLMEHVAPYAPAGPVWLLNEVTEASFSIDLPASVRRWCDAHARAALIIDCAEQEDSTGPALAAQLERSGLPAILMAPTGRHAEVAQRFLLARGVVVPGEVVVVSALADSATRRSEPFIPAVDTDGWGHGLQAVEAMVDWLETDTAPRDIVLTPQLVRR